MCVSMCVLTQLYKRTIMLVHTLIYRESSFSSYILNFITTNDINKTSIITFNRHRHY